MARVQASGRGIISDIKYAVKNTKFSSYHNLKEVLAFMNLFYSCSCVSTFK